MSSSCSESPTLLRLAQSIPGLAARAYRALLVRIKSRSATMATHDTQSAVLGLLPHGAGTSRIPFARCSGIASEAARVTRNELPKPVMQSMLYSGPSDVARTLAETMPERRRNPAPGPSPCTRRQRNRDVVVNGSVARKYPLARSARCAGAWGRDHVSRRMPLGQLGL